jgi:hypothetical protein
MQTTPMSEAKFSLNRLTHHGSLPALAIGGLSVVLVAGLEAFGILSRLNLVLGRWLSHDGSGNFPKAVAQWVIWLAAAAFAFGLAYAILHVPSTWRRVILWISTVVIIGAWGPVLVLAAHAPDIAGPWIAAVWSGVCALVYAGNHRLACDRAADRVAQISPRDPHEAR